MNSTEVGGTASLLTGSRSKSLREFKQTHINEDLSGVPIGEHENTLFHGCTLEKLAGATLKNCVLSNSKLTTTQIEDALGLTLTLDCHTFDELEVSPLLFDLLLVLLMKTKGNTEKRRQLLEVVGRERVRELLSKMSELEQ